MSEYDDLLFGVRRSVRYHTRRRGHFEFAHRLVLLLALLLSSTAVATLAGAIGSEWPLWAKSLPAGLVSLLAAFDLVIGTSQRAWHHADLARQFIDLERELERKTEPLDALVASVTDRRLQIEAGEPPVLRVLDTICHNELLRALGYGKEEEVEVRWFQRAMAPFFDVAEWRLRKT